MALIIYRHYPDAEIFAIEILLDKRQARRVLKAGAGL
jgi:hypothetical protein